MEKVIQDGAAVRFGWQTFKDNVGFLIGAMVVTLVALLVLFGVAFGLGNYSMTLSAIAMIAYYALAIVVGIGWMKIALTFVDGGKPTYADLFKHWNLFLKYFGVSLLYALIVMGGTLLFVIPGMYWSLKFYFAPFLVIDKGMGPIEALKESARLTDGVKWDLFGFMMVAGTVAMLGYIALFVGVIV